MTKFRKSQMLETPMTKNKAVHVISKQTFAITKGLKEHIQ